MTVSKSQTLKNQTEQNKINPLLIKTQIQKMIKRGALYSQLDKNQNFNGHDEEAVWFVYNKSQKTAT